MVRQRVCDITVVGRSGMGVRLVRLSEGAKLVSVSVVEAEEEQSADGATAPAGDLAEEKTAVESAPVPETEA
jgi:DNA gyrase/topoisomerase IV subunit A